MMHALSYVSRAFHIILAELIESFQGIPKQPIFKSSFSFLEHREVLG